MVKVSVIVPVYNVENYIEKCLDSLLAQTIDEIEILAVDDGSKDTSGEIIDAYAAKYENITAFHKPNGGLSDARNFGLQYAIGEFIAFVDSDDYVDCDMLKKMVDKAILEDLDIVVCDTTIEYEHTAYPLASNLHYTDDKVKAYIFAHPMACTRLVRKTIMDQFQFEKGIFYEDLNVTPTYVLATKRIGFLEEPFYHYVQRDASIMNQREFSEKLLDIFTVLQHVKDAFANQKMEKQYHDELEYLYIIHLLRSATLRFLQYKNGTGYVKRINEIMNTYYPNWRQNIYFKRSNRKFRLVCWLAYKEHYSMLKGLMKLQK